MVSGGKTVISPAIKAAIIVISPAIEAAIIPLLSNLCVIFSSFNATNNRQKKSTLLCRSTSCCLSESTLLDMPFYKCAIFT